MARRSVFHSIFPYFAVLLLLVIGIAGYHYYVNNKQSSETPIEAEVIAVFKDGTQITLNDPPMMYSILYGGKEVSYFIIRPKITMSYSGELSQVELQSVQMVAQVYGWNYIITTKTWNSYIVPSFNKNSDGSVTFYGPQFMLYASDIEKTLKANNLGSGSYGFKVDISLKIVAKFSDGSSDVKDVAGYTVITAVYDDTSGKITDAKLEVEFQPKFT